MWSASDSRGEPCDRGDHGRTGRWTAQVNSRTLSAGRSGSPPADRNALQQEHESWAHPVHEDQWILGSLRSSRGVGCGRSRRRRQEEVR